MPRLHDDQLDGSNRAEPDKAKPTIDKGWLWRELERVALLRALASMASSCSFLAATVFAAGPRHCTSRRETTMW